MLYRHDKTVVLSTHILQMMVRHSGGKMIAKKIKPLVPGARKLSSSLFLEALSRSLIILCIALAVVLSSIAVCDGRWLLSGRHMFGLWFSCVGDVDGSGVPSNCSRNLTEDPNFGVGLCRTLVSLAVVSAVFGLELLVLSQVSEGRGSRRRWRLGVWLVLLAAGLAAAGGAKFVILFWEFASPLGLTLTFWCQFTATCLFFLNGMAARDIENMSPCRGDAGKPLASSNL